MRKIIVAVLCLFICFSSYALASIPSVIGVTWKQMSTQDKQYYISGLFHGALLYETAIMKKASDYQALAFFPNISFDDMIVALDKFYGDEQNANISVDTALHAIKMDLSGEKKELIDKYLRIERKAAADVIEQIKRGEIPGANWNENTNLSQSQIKGNFIEDTIPMPGGITFTVLVNKDNGLVEYYWHPSGGWISVKDSQINFQELYGMRRTLRMIPKDK